MLRSTTRRAATAALTSLVAAGLVWIPSSVGHAADRAPQARKAATFSLDLGNAVAVGQKRPGEKPVRMLLLPAKAKFTPPSGAERVGAYGSAVAKINGEKVIGTVGNTYVDSTGDYSSARLQFLFTIQPRHVGKEIKVTKVSLEYYTSPERATVAGKASSDKTRVRAMSTAIVNHFGKKKVLYIHGRSSYLGKKASKYKSQVRYWERLSGARVTVQKHTAKGWKKLTTLRLDRSGTGVVRRGIKKKPTRYRVKFAGDRTHTTFTAASLSWSGKPKKGWPRAKSRVLPY